MEYRIIYGVSCSDLNSAVTDLQRQIRRVISEGWKLQGGVSITMNKNIYIVCQAIYR